MTRKIRASYQQITHDDEHDWCAGQGCWCFYIGIFVWPLWIVMAARLLIQQLPLSKTWAKRALIAIIVTAIIGIVMSLLNRVLVIFWY